MSLIPGEVLENRYLIAGPIGQGGFGAVYLAQDTSLQMPVALKENQTAGQDSQEQFIQEAILLSRLRHPNLPRVTHYFIIRGRGQYLVMDFVQGKSLRKLIEERGGPLTEAEALPWIRQVCDALHYLHTYNPPIIHRDVKPDNVIVTAAGQAMLVDFGISKIYQSGQGTHSGARAYSEGYSPPEQYGKGGGTNPRSDVYALGATLYVMLTATLPPESPEIAAGNEDLIPPRRINPRISSATEQAILAAMNVNASRRLNGAAALRDALSGRSTSQPAGQPTGQSARAASAAPAAARPAAAPAAVAPRPASARQETRSGSSGCVQLLVLLVILAAGAFAATRFLGISLPFMSSNPVVSPTTGENETPLPMMTAVAPQEDIDKTNPSDAPAAPTEEAVAPPTTVPAPVLTIGGRVRVTTPGNDLNFRDGPNGTLKGEFANGAELTVIDGPREAGGYVWYLVRGEAGEGWSAAEFMTPIR